MEVRLPELSAGSSGTVITVWHVREGGRVEKDQDLLEVATDKATFDVPSPCAGVVVHIAKKEGEYVEKGEIIAELEECSRSV